MRIAIVTDAWKPQVNGVVRTLEATRRELTAQGHEVLVVSPEGRWSWPCPTYPEIRLAYAGRERVAARWRAERPSHVHIATEGPVGLAARRHCLAHGLPFTTSYHTRFPEYLAARAPVPTSEVAALRGACPPAEGRDADLVAARTLLERPEIYAAALAR